MGVRQSKISVGDQFGEVVVIAKSDKMTQTNPRRTLFVCQCSCGVVKEIDAGNLKKPTFRSCGHVRTNLAREKGRAKRTERSHGNIVFHGIKHGARVRKIPFELTLDDFMKEAVKPCVWCGDEPIVRSYVKSGIPTALHGLDRIDNKEGYTVKNVMSCCAICNRMRHVMTTEEFKTRINCVADRLKRGLLP